MLVENFILLSVIDTKHAGKFLEAARNYMS